MAWLFLIGSIIFEVAGTLSLLMAVTAAKHGYINVVAGYLLAFSLLALTLANGIALGMAYGIWTAAGVALTAVLGRFLFDEPFTWLMGLGIVLIIGAVLLIELGNPAH